MLLVSLVFFFRFVTHSKNYAKEFTKTNKLTSDVALPLKKTPSYEITADLHLIFSEKRNSGVGIKMINNDNVPHYSMIFSAINNFKNM